MAITLDAAAAGFEDRFKAFLSTKREVSEDVDTAVRNILATVRAEGDTALFEYTRRFDRFDPSGGKMTVTDAEIDAAFEAADPMTV